MSDLSDQMNRETGAAIGMDAAEVERIQRVLHGNAMVALQLYCAGMAEEGIGPASASATLLQVALHGVIHTSGPGAPVTDWLRALCDTLDREIAGKEPLPAQVQRLQKLTLAVMAARTKGPMQ